MAKKLTSTKAKEMLHNPPHGKPLTEKQRKFFGAIANAQNGIEAYMGGLTDKGFNYNGAWGGQFQMGGQLPQAQDGKNIEYKELPEITIVLSKDKQTRDFYNNLIDKLSENQFGNSENPYIDQTIMGEYLGLMNLGKEYGFPKVKSETNEGVYKKAKGHYNPLTKTIYANDIPTWVGEMAHHVQMKDKIVDKTLEWLGNDFIEYLKQPIESLKGKSLSNPYIKEGTVEHEAHSVIEPMLQKKLRQDYKKYRNSELSESRKKRFFYEMTNQENDGEKNILKDFQMGGNVLPGAMGNMYARHGAPSEGKYAKKTLPSAQNGKEMSFYQQGLDFQPKTISKNGGWLDKYDDDVVKDDMGYWNPDNWGKPVEIGSNVITMDGVYEPLIGVSDTGDVQYMEPGEDYVFDGDSVTEYPIAQNGEQLNKEGWGYKGDARFMKKTTPSGETRYGWNPGNQYDLYRTVTPFKTRRGIRRHTPVPQSSEDVDFLVNYSNEPVTKVEYEGAKHWNIPRFLVEPHISEKRGESKALMSEGPQSKQEYKKNILADVYKYQMLQNQGDRKKAWGEAKSFMRKNVNPLLKGEVYKTLADEGRQPFSAGLLTSAINEDFFKNEEILKSDVKLNNPYMTSYEKEYMKQPLSDKKVDRYAFDWLTKYKKMPKKEARQYIKTERDKGKKEANQYEKEYKETFENGGWLDKYK
jgi:hypothetical protein